MTNGNIIGVVSIKGGVGKTTAVANLGAALSHEFGKKVLLVDANFSAPNLGLHLGIINPQYTLHDVLADKISIGKAIVQHEGGFHVLPASLVPSKIDPFKLKKKLEPLRQFYDTILIDSSPTLNEEILATMLASDQLLVVTSPDYPTLSCTLHAIKVAKQRKTPIAGLILNHVRGKEFELTLDDVEKTAEVPVLAIVNDDIKILEALANTTPVTLHAPERDAVIEYKKLAAALVGETFKDRRLKARFRSFFLAAEPSRVDVNRSLLKSENLGK